MTDRSAAIWGGDRPKCEFDNGVQWKRRGGWAGAALIAMLSKTGGGGVHKPRRVSIPVIVAAHGF